MNLFASIIQFLKSLAYQWQYVNIESLQKIWYKLVQHTTDILQTLKQ